MRLDEITIERVAQSMCFSGRHTSKRFLKACKEWGIENLQDLFQLTPQDIAIQYIVGGRTLRDLWLALARMGIELPDSWSDLEMMNMTVPPVPSRKNYIAIELAIG